MAKKNRDDRKRSPTIQITLSDPAEIAAFEEIMAHMDRALNSPPRAGIAKAAMWLGMTRLWRDPWLVASVKAPHVCEHKGGELVASDEDCPHRPRHR